MFKYRVVCKQFRATDDKVAGLTELLNSQAREGWEFDRLIEGRYFVFKREAVDA